MYRTETESVTPPDTRRMMHIPAGAVHLQRQPRGGRGAPEEALPRPSGYSTSARTPPLRLKDQVCMFGADRSGGRVSRIERVQFTAGSIKGI